MSRKFSIKSTDTGAKLEFFNFRNDYFTLMLSSPALNASKDIWLYTENDYSDFQSLVNFFKEIARAWKGWEGKKTWSSIEGDFVLSCTSDKLGHITLQIELVQLDEIETWSANFNLKTEAGQLEKISKEIAMLSCGDVYPLNCI
ncbi:DUF6228 family protein [Nostoc sp. C117]|uniref:DUF6228 family protein n=1 Tax=Nostoc sp. C117 TaxID=3349875 RepID=UPI00370DA883